MALKTAERESARDRLLAAADELFYAEGVHVVGVDRIVERAGVTKASLYNTFRSKDELVRAYLENHFRRRQARVAHILAANKTPRERLLAVFGEVEDFLSGSAFRGCRFISAAAESQPGDAGAVVAEEYRAWLWSLFTDLAKAAGAAVAARMDQDRGAAAKAVKSAAIALLDAAVPPKRRSRRAR